ncbi:FtsW/RodA/SpoVE family cell cycle protein [Clostridium gasigenes]|uniref:FtsW/RodA/SpoVE family cell cycle protein n=1 Tax=Clostridium gasigenes TaxID=94869 RepID=UPI00143862C4|nr:FtsW/RodA/SpoVE family cell cycle protein [Clostridium gasigenes]NKF08672.1 FtsW/RodA/SpoVE family cell cycle protein [Clostridium gasigenes]QSW21228.1 FtsW/RodA/SpoVE family cell cycle protein [Clostridium gasigenes]
MQSIDNKMVDEYVNNVCGLVKNKKVHENIKEELLGHIYEIVEEYIERGKSEEEAINQALLQMGSFDVIGSSLNKVHKAAPDWILLRMTSMFILFSIFTLGFMGINASSSGHYLGEISKKYIIRNGLYLIIGIAVVMGISKIDYRSLKKYSKYIYIGAIIISIIGFSVCPVVNGTMGWVRIGVMSFNVLYIAPILLTLSLAGIYENYDWSSLKNILIGFALGFGPGLIFLVAPSVTSLVIYTIAVTTLMIISGIKLRYVIISLGTLGMAFTAVIFQTAYNRARITAFLRPIDDPYDVGWIYNQIYMLRKSAGLFGQGGNYALDVLPLANSDYILTYIIYTFGWIVGIILIALVLAFIIRIGFIGVNTKDKYGKLIVSGLCSLFATQFLLNILMNLNLAPAFAISLPFISYGGTALIINIFSIGIITNVYKWRNTPYITA